MPLQTAGRSATRERDAVPVLVTAERAKLINIASLHVRTLSPVGCTRRPTDNIRRYVNVAAGPTVNTNPAPNADPNAKNIFAEINRKLEDMEKTTTEKDSIIAQMMANQNRKPKALRMPLPPPSPTPSPKPWRNCRLASRSCSKAPSWK